MLKMTRHQVALLLLLAATAVLAGTGCGDDSPTENDDDDDRLNYIRTIDDLNYVRGKYFFLQRPADRLASNATIEPGSVRVFLDDQNGSNNQGVREGRAAVDPTRPPAAGDTLHGSFDGLRELDDFLITVNYFGDSFPVLELRTPIPSSHMLAVTYEEILPGGARRSVGSVPADGPMVLKLVQTPRSLLKADDADPTYFESDPVVDPLSVTRELELKNFYDLLATNIDPQSLHLEVHRYATGVPSPPYGYAEGNEQFSYLQILGADLFRDNGSGAALEGPDTRVDQFTSAWFLDLETGHLYFPDLRPFDPRITPRPDARAEEDLFFRSRISGDPSVPGLRGRVLWPPGLTGAPGVAGGGVTPVALQANRNPYDKRTMALTQDRRYSIKATFHTGSPKAMMTGAPTP